MNDESVISDIAKELAPILYSDLKSWMGSLGVKVKQIYSRAKLKSFANPQEILVAIDAKELNAGDQIQINTVPAPFGPFLRRHFLTPIVGMHTSQRLGPRISSGHPAMDILTQASTHLIPVGLYPLISEDIHQCCLYPPDASACGFISIIPGVRDLVPYLFALFASDHTQHYGNPCKITGILRFVDAATLVSAGFTLEEHEALRQAGNVWFIDATGEKSEVIPLHQHEYSGLWGGLYASSHLEIGSGELAIAKVLDVFRAAFEEEGFKGSVHRNQAGRREIALCAEGIRATIDSTSPFWSVHMDAEVTRDFGTYRDAFDAITRNVLGNLEDLAKAESVELLNPGDLDFTYTNSSQSFTVLKSLSADSIQDPLAIAVRNWHRLRGQ